MQAKDDIKDLFDGFEKEFGKGDWNAIESRVQRNNAQFAASKKKYKWGVAFGAVACLLLGAIHFTTSIQDAAQVDADSAAIQRSEANTAATDERVVDSKIPAELTEEQSIAPSEVEAVSTVDNSAGTSSNSEDDKLAQNDAIVSNEEIEVGSKSAALRNPVNQKPRVQAPDFVLEKSTYCLGDKLSFVVKPNAKNSLELRLNGKQLDATDLKNYALSAAGTSKISILRNNEVVRTHEITVQAPPARIGYNKNYDVHNPYVNFKALNASVESNYSWFIDNELVSNDEDFQYTFASKGMYRVKMIVRSSAGCKDSSVKSIRILRGYNLMATTIFNPTKETWMPLGLKKNGISFKLRIVDQKGNTVFTSTDPNKTWNGELDSSRKAENGDIFYWVAKVTNESGKVSEYANSLLVSSNLE